MELWDKLPVLSRSSPVCLFVTPWTVAHQAPLSVGFSRQEYWKGLPALGKSYLRKPGSAAFSCRESKLWSVLCWSKRGHSRVGNPRKKQCGQS